MRYYFKLNGRDVGPMDSGEITALLGRLDPDATACPEDKDHTLASNWTRAGDLAELAEFLPAETREEAPAPQLPAVAQEAPEAELLPGPGDKLRVLISDDDQQIRELLWHTLAEDGHEVEFARDGEEVFKVLGRGHFDVLILDVSMPKMNGYKVSEKIVKNIKNRPRILLYTSRDIEREKLQFYCSEADAIIQKGAPINDILATVHGFFNKGQSADSSQILKKEEAKAQIRGARWLSEVPAAGAPEAAMNETRDKNAENLNLCLNRLTMLESIVEQKNSRYEGFIRSLLEEKSKSEKNMATIRALTERRRTDMALIIVSMLLSLSALSALLFHLRQ